MTTFQKTLALYIKGSKNMAYLAFLNDPTSRKDIVITFEKFCKEFDKIAETKKSKN